MGEPVSCKSNKNAYLDQGCHREANIPARTGSRLPSLPKLDISVDMYAHLFDMLHLYQYVHMGMCFFDVAVPGGWYKGYESQVWFGVWLGGMIRGMARAPLNSCFVALDTAKLPCAGNWIAVRIWTA